jgi:hypothetical protein
MNNYKKKLSVSQIFSQWDVSCLRMDLSNFISNAVRKTSTRISKVSRSFRAYCHSMAIDTIVCISVCVFLGRTIMWQHN